MDNFNLLLVEMTASALFIKKVASVTNLKINFLYSQTEIRNL